MRTRIENDYVLAMLEEYAGCDWETALDEIRVDNNPVAAARMLLFPIIQAVEIEHHDQDILPWMTTIRREVANAVRAATPQTREENARNVWAEEEPETYDPDDTTYTESTNYQRDIDGVYDVLLDPELPVEIVNLTRDSIVDWSRSVRQNSQRWLAKVNVEIIDRCDNWDGFTYRNKHIFFTRALFKINTQVVGRDPADFAVGPVIVSPGSHAVCGICANTKFRKTWSLDLSERTTREQQTDATAQIIEHAMSIHTRNLASTAALNKTLSEPGGAFKMHKHSINRPIPACVQTALTFTGGSIPVYIKEARF